MLIGGATCRRSRYLLIPIYRICRIPTTMTRPDASLRSAMDRNHTRRLTTNRNKNGNSTWQQQAEVVHPLHRISQRKTARKHRRAVVGVKSPYTCVAWAEEVIPNPLITMRIHRAYRTRAPFAPTRHNQQRISRTSLNARRRQLAPLRLRIIRSCSLGFSRLRPVIPLRRLLGPIRSSC